MRLLTSVCVAAIGVWLGGATAPHTPAPAPIHFWGGPTEFVYYKPGDVNYAYGPVGDALTAMGPPSANITVTYTVGFDPAAQPAFDMAANIWAHVIASPIPIRVLVNSGSGFPANFLAKTSLNLACTWLTSSSGYVTALSKPWGATSDVK